MTSVVEVKKLLKPLTTKHQDLCVSGKLLAIKPVTHLARGIYIGRTSSADCFTPFVAVNCLFEPRATFKFNYGEEIYPKKKGLWLFSREGVNEELADRIEDLALPRLHEVKTIEDFLHYGLKGHFFAGTLEYAPLRKLYIYLALGYLQAAGEILQQFSKHPQHWAEMAHTSEHFTELMDVVRPLVYAQDKPAIAALLHKWEVYSVKQLKLEKYWQKTPFPIEL